MSMARRVGGSFALAVALVMSVQSSALAAVVNVEIGGPAPGFTPATAKPKQGDSVLWTNADDIAHTTTSNGCPSSGEPGVGLWCSPSMGQNATYSFIFRAAAKYPYVCIFHASMKGTVQVNMKASPMSGGTGTTFTIVWAKASIPNGFNADVQIKRPGDASFSNWMLNQVNTMVSESFTPDQGVGTYQFRSRLQNDASGGASNYSKPVSIQVS
ncbi:MAG: hypothetical protein H0W27_03290 [Actinobacteria bacterium]|nr:hypothetical protein [Actinomycetota bacterium]